MALNLSSQIHPFTYQSRETPTLKLTCLTAWSMDFIVNTVSDSVSKKINHHLKFNENLHKLKRKYEELNSRKEDVELRIKVELQSGKKLKKEVQLWLANVQRINDKKQSIENEVGKGNYFKHAILGELIAETIQELEEIYQKGSFSDSLVLDAPPRNGDVFPPTRLAGETTAIRNMEEIWDFLMHDEIRLIGVFGMGGIGKTTIMQQISNRLLEHTDKFVSVIWITISKGHDVFRLQDCIASKLKVSLSGYEDETTRAAKLFVELSEKRRYVLILDDMWEAFELKNVGIPEPTSANGCKIVLTTRSLDVCRNMECRAIKIELLTENEAWNLFLDKVGSNVLYTPGLEVIMKLVAKECACLPLAIITIAGSMKGVVDECEWRNALEELRGATGGLIDMKRLHEQLKYSYTRLKDEKLQQCLLYCALYPEDFEIKRKELIVHLIDEGIIEGTSGQAQFDKGHSILNKLENACLLERITKDFNSKCVKMHDLIRDMALQVMGRGCMVKAGVQLEDLPSQEKWTVDLERVSLMNNHISEIHFGAAPRCYRLSTLLLFGNGGLRRIPDSFFAFMFGLRVLDLSHTGIEILPRSISNLFGLTALLLRWCSNLKHMPSLSTLFALRKLDLGGSGIEEVPESIGTLSNLDCLNLNAEYLQSLPFVVLPHLFRLRYLIVWWGSKTLKVRAKEVACLQNLETFAGQFHDLRDYNKFISLFRHRMLRKYLLQVGSHGEFLDFDEEESYFSKYVGLTECNISGGGGGGGGGGDTLLLPEDIRELEIKECHDVTSVCNVSSMHHANRRLKYCKIINCDRIECVISCFHCILHQSLEVLQLEDLQSLRVLFRGEEAAMGAFSRITASPMGGFSSLKELRIFKCPNIRKLFTPGLLPNLENLEEIHVEDCEGMEEIIGARAQGEGHQERGTGESSSHSIVSIEDTIVTITLPKLRRLTLEDMPELKNIVCSGAVMACDSLQILTLLSCPKLKRLPLYLPMLNGEPSPPTALLQIEINDREWWELLEWNPPNAKDVLEPLLLQLDGRGLPVR